MIFATTSLKNTAVNQIKTIIVKSVILESTPCPPIDAKLIQACYAIANNNLGESIWQ